MTTKEWPTAEWPRDWRNVPLWAMFDRVKDIGHPDEEMLSVYRDYGVIEKNSREDNANQTAENRNIYQLVDKGWLVVNRMKAWQGSVGISPLRGIVSGHYICFRPKHNEDRRFLNWLLRSDIYRTEYARMSRGVRPGQIEIDNDELHGLRIALPWIEAQRRIADFLDQKVARIDALIAAKQRMAALLVERFNALVTGLLFATPGTHLVPIGFICSCLAGFAFPSDSFTQDETDAVRLLRGVNVTPGSVKWDEVVYIARTDVNVSAFTSYALSVGDLVIGMDRPLIKSGMRVAEVRSSDLPALLVQRVARLRANSLSTNAFLRYLLMSKAFEHYFTPIVTGVSVPHISDEQILSFPVPMLPLDQQDAIVARLQTAELHVTQLRVALQEQIDLLRERRQSMIATGVTGQFEIRDAV